MIIERKKSLETIVVLMGALLVFYFIFHVELLLYISLGLAVLSIISGWLTDRLAWLWLEMAEGIGYVVSRILLTIIFYLVLTPLGLLSRLFTKDNLQLKGNRSSYFIERNHRFKPEDLENIW